MQSMFRTFNNNNKNKKIENILTVIKDLKMFHYVFQNFVIKTTNTKFCLKYKLLNLCIFLYKILQSGLFFFNYEMW